MRALRPVLKYMQIANAVAITLCVLVASVGVWSCRRAHELASFSLPGGHKIRVLIDYNFDIADDVLCELSGPSVHHAARYIGSIGASQSRPSFTLHRVPNSQGFWITSETLPQTVLYAVDLDTGEYWPGDEDSALEELKGKRLLEMVNSTEKDHTLYDYSRWLGVEQPSQSVEPTDARQASGGVTSDSAVFCAGLSPPPACVARLSQSAR